MTEPLSITAPPAPADAAPGANVRALMERQLAVLGRLAEAGFNIALAIERQALAAEAGEPAEGAGAPVVQGDIALAYGRVSRAVRLTIALQGRVVEALQTLDEAALRRRKGEVAEAQRARESEDAARKARVERIVERLIQAEAKDEAEADRLADEAYERLETDDIYGDLRSRPVSEIIALICEDLGLTPDWRGLSKEAWAEAEAKSGEVGAPLMTLRWIDPPADTGAKAKPRAPPKARSP